MEKLKIKYVFMLERDPEKDINNAIYTLANDLFTDDFYNHILPNIFGVDNPNNYNSEMVDNAIGIFIENLPKRLENKSIMLKKLILLPENIKRLKKEIKEVVE